MRFQLTIECDNEAFHGERDDGTEDTFSRDAEVAVILRRLATRLESEPSEGGPLHDSNGNRVGSYSFTRQGGDQ